MKKKKIIGLLMAMTIIFNIGCTSNLSNNENKDNVTSKEIVFEENVMESSYSNVKVTQEDFNFVEPEGYQFNFKFYKDGNIYGELADKSVSLLRVGQSIYVPYYGNASDKLYTINDNLVVEKTEDNILIYDEDEGIKGINSNYFGSDRHTIRYFNYETNEIKELYRKKYLGQVGWVEYASSAQENVSEKLIEGNENFGYTIYNYSLNGESLVSLQVVDLITGEVYEYEAKGEGINFIIDILYDKSTDKFYAVNKEGIIYEVALENKEVKLKEKEQLDLNGIELLNEKQVNINKSGEIILLYQYFSNGYAAHTESGYDSIYDESLMGNSKESNELVISYNPATNNIKKIMQNDKKNFEVVEFWKESNLCLLEKYNLEGGGMEYYIGELKDDRIDIYHKIELNEEVGEVIWIYNKLMNDDNTELIIQFKSVSNDEAMEDYFTSSVYPNEFKDYIIKINIER
ncbi:MAG: hypothetical protein ACLSXJ_11555 [Clostridium saudiense]|uniref:hypothetical protein n=1 Tax=Clostridium saudiense TaxID=1414720 RepID=UPI0018AA91DF|nr:hypothetical protein [Clostridium saudiense]